MTEDFGGFDKTTKEKFGEFDKIAEKILGNSIKVLFLQRIINTL